MGHGGRGVGWSTNIPLKLYARFSVFFWGDSQSYLISPHPALLSERLRTSLFASYSRAGTLIFDLHPHWDFFPCSQPPACVMEKTGNVDPNTLPSPYVTQVTFSNSQSLSVLSSRVGIIMPTALFIYVYACLTGFLAHWRFHKVQPPPLFSLIRPGPAEVGRKVGLWVIWIFQTDSQYETEAGHEMVTSPRMVTEQQREQGILAGLGWLINLMTSRLLESPQPFKGPLLWGPGQLGLCRADCQAHDLLPWNKCFKSINSARIHHWNLHHARHPAWSQEVPSEFKVLNNDVYGWV